MNIPSKAIKSNLPPSKAGKGIIFTTTKANEIKAIKFKTATIPLWRVNFVMAKIPTGPTTLEDNGLMLPCLKEVPIK